MEAGIVPDIRAEAREFWEAINNGEFCIQRCFNCSEYVFYPRPFCPYDMGALEFVKVSGKGQILSYTVVRKHSSSSFRDHLPLIIAVIQLEEGPTMLSRMINVTPEELSFHQKVEVVIEKISEDFSLPFFTPMNK